MSQILQPMTDEVLRSVTLPSTDGFGALETEKGVLPLKALDESEQRAALRLRAQMRGLELADEAALYLQRHFPRDMDSLYGLLDTLDEVGAGCIAFSPLGQGLLTNKYLNGVPESSRATFENSSLLKHFLKPENI